MCNLYRLKTASGEIASLLDATDDPHNQIAIEKNLVAPEKPGLVVRDVSVDQA